jgi:hypothetical protein
VPRRVPSRLASVPAVETHGPDDRPGLSPATNRPMNPSSHAQLRGE